VGFYGPFCAITGIDEKEFAEQLRRAYITVRKTNWFKAGHRENKLVEQRIEQVRDDPTAISDYKWILKFETHEIRFWCADIHILAGADRSKAQNVGWEMIKNAVALSELKKREE
jgi:hypothetical protein